MKPDQVSPYLTQGRPSWCEYVHIKLHCYIHKCSIKNLIIYKYYIKYLKALYLKEATDWCSWIVLLRVLYNTAPLYLSAPLYLGDLLLTHKSIPGTYTLFNWLDLVSRDETSDTLLNMSDRYGGFKSLRVL